MSRRLAAVLVLTLAIGVMLPLGMAEAGGGCHSASGELTSSTDRTVAIAGCSFQDTVTFIEPGVRVSWVNADEIPHTVTGAAGSWGDDSYLDRGDRIAYTFEDEGVFPYYCALHPSMVGVVVVGSPSADAALMPGGIEQSMAGADASDTITETAASSDSGFPVWILALGAAAVLGAAAFFRARLRAVRLRPVG